MVEKKIENSIERGIENRVGYSNRDYESEPSIYSANGIVSLKNTYYLVRHGESKANVSELVVSSLENGIKAEYGLTDKGQRQAKISAELFMLQSKNFESLKKSIKIISSPFSRAFETAEILRKTFDIDSQVIVNNGLRERFYGAGELGPSSVYADVWLTDQKDESSSDQGSESVESVRERMAKVILDMEKELAGSESSKGCEGGKTGSIVFLVSHGDPIYILESFVKGYSFSKSHIKPYVRNAEIRSVN
jgi:broad specificity phosphatase PhoE